MERDAAVRQARPGYQPGHYTTERGGGLVAPDGRLVERWWELSRYDLREPPGGELVDPVTGTVPFRARRRKQLADL